MDKIINFFKKIFIKKEVTREEEQEAIKKIYKMIKES